MEWPQWLAPKLAQHPDQGRRVEGNHRAGTRITSNDGAGFGVVEFEAELCAFLRMPVEIIGEQDFVFGRPDMMDGHVAGRIDFQNLCAPHREAPSKGLAGQK